MLFLAMHGGVAIYLMVQWDVFETPFMHILKFSVQHQNGFVKCFIKIKTFGRTKYLSWLKVKLSFIGKPLVRAFQ